MRRIQADRCEDRHQFTEEILAYPFTLGVVPMAATEKLDILFGQSGQDHIIQNLVLMIDQCVCFCADFRKYLFW